MTYLLLQRRLVNIAELFYYFLILTKVGEKQANPDTTNFLSRGIFASSSGMLILSRAKRCPNSSTDPLSLFRFLSASDTGLWFVLPPCLVQEKGRYEVASNVADAEATKSEAASKSSAAGFLPR